MTLTIGCEKSSDSETVSPDRGESEDGEDGEGGLEQISADITAEVESITASIENVDTVIEKWAEFEANENIDIALLATAVKAAYDGESVELELEVSPEIRAEIDAFLELLTETAKALGDAAKGAGEASKNIADLVVKGKMEAEKLKALNETKLKNPLLKGDSRAEVEGDLSEVERLESEIESGGQAAADSLKELAVRAAESQMQLAKAIGVQVAAAGQI